MTGPSDADLPAIEIGAAFELRFDTALRLPQRLDLHFDDTLIGEGWHQAESSPGGSFRWMGIGETASVDIVVDRRRDLDVAVGIYMMIAPHVDAALKVSIDGGKALPLARTSEGLSFILPRRDDEPGVTTICFHAGEGIVREPDARRLSVAFSYLRARAARGGADGDPLTLVLHAQLAERLRVVGGGWPVTRDGTPIALGG